MSQIWSTDCTQTATADSFRCCDRWEIDAILMSQICRNVCMCLRMCVRVFSVPLSMLLSVVLEKTLSRLTTGSFRTVFPRIKEITKKLSMATNA